MDVELKQYGLDSLVKSYDRLAFIMSTLHIIGFKRSVLRDVRIRSVQVVITFDLELNLTPDP